MIQQGERATIGMQCAGGGCDNRRVWLLANSVLVEDAKMEECGYWQAVCWWKM
jgi:hypothetical protein